MKFIKCSIVFKMQKEPLNRLSEYDNILIVGGGGGCDIWLGLPIYRYLKSLNKNVVLANLSFTDDLDQYQLFEECNVIHKIEEKLERTQKNKTYFPEHDMSLHVNQPVYAIKLRTPNILYFDLKKFVEKLNINIIVAIDAGFDGIMYGHESDQSGNYYGSPLEDMCMIVSLAKLKDEIKMPIWWICGSVPTEGIPIQYFYQNLANQIKHKGFLGCTFPLMNQEGKDDYLRLLNKSDTLKRTIPNESFHASLEGECDMTHYVNDRLTSRFENESDNKIADINDYPPVYPITGIYWFFDVKKLKERSPLIKRLYEYVFIDGKLNTFDYVTSIINFHNEIRRLFRNLS